jgi:hypothetical protein
MPDLEGRVAALEATVAMLTRKLVASGDITLNDARAAHGLPPFREPWADGEPTFMQHVKAEPLDGHGPLTIRLTHEPAGITIAARDRAEGICKLRKALADRARRDYDLQETQRRRERKTEGTPGAP